MTTVQTTIAMVRDKPDADEDFEFVGEELAWPAGVQLPMPGEIFVFNGEPREITDMQWNYDHTPTVSHLGYTFFWMPVEYDDHIHVGDLVFPK